MVFDCVKLLKDIGKDFKMMGEFSKDQGPLFFIFDRGRTFSKSQFAFHYQGGLFD